MFSGKGIAQLLYRLLDLEAGEGRNAGSQNCLGVRSQPDPDFGPGSENSLGERGLIVERN